jgi:psp operon transcriptional activator
MTELRTATAREERPGWCPSPEPVVGLRTVQTGAVHRIPLTGSFDLGSDLARHIPILNDPSVSRKHCRFDWRTGRDGLELWVIDTGSSNGTFVNDLQVRELRLVDGAVVRVGRTSLVAFAAASQTRRTRDEWLVGHSLRLRAALDRAVGALKDKRPVLICGERGTGRRAFARALHELVCGPAAPYSETLCLNDDPMRSTADLTWRKRTTLKAAAGGGLLYIHELNVQPGNLQARLALPALELADEQELCCVISASEPCADGVLPDDIASVTLPSLRDRGPADLAALTDHFLERFFAQGPRLQAETREDIVVPTHVSRTLAQYHWPGNVAELSKTIERIAALLAARGNSSLAARELKMSRSTLHEWFTRRGLSLAGIVDESAI